MIWFIILITSLFILALPQSAMWIQWHLDKVIRNTYTKPWSQESLSAQSRAYHQHIVNHCHISMVATAMMCFSSFFGQPWRGLSLMIVSCLIMGFSLAYPFIKEWYIDPVVFKKPLNDLDWRERCLGSLLPLPLFIVALIMRIWLMG